MSELCLFCIALAICKINGLLLLEMLIVLQRAIVAAPSESVLFEELVGKVATVYFIAEFFGAVSIFAPRFRAYYYSAVSSPFHVWIV